MSLKVNQVEIDKAKAERCFKLTAIRYDKVNGNEKLFIEESCMDLCPWFGVYCDGF